MKFTMIIGGLICFGFALWSAQAVASDIQIIVVEVAVIGGFIMFGLAGILLVLEDRATKGSDGD